MDKMELVYELRIGNLVSKSLKSGNGRTLIDKVGPQDIVRIYENISHFNYESIMLTEEWLLKLGYSPCTFTNNHFNADGHRVWKCNDLFMCDKNGIVLKWVHQLQNLYFALNGKDLTLNQ